MSQNDVIHAEIIEHATENLSAINLPRIKRL